jgi:hypothetical protein
MHKNPFRTTAEFVLGSALHTTLFVAACGGDSTESIEREDT